MVSFSGWGGLGALVDGLMGPVYLWGSLGSFHCFFWVVCQHCNVTWFCHVVLWLVVDYSDQWRRDLGVLLEMYGIKLVCHFFAH